MNDYQPLNQLPVDIQADFGARLNPATPTAFGVFRLVAARRTEGRGFEGQRITVLVVDENGFPMPNVRVAFAYSTAKSYVITEDFQWNPPPPQLAFVVPTAGGGQIDQIQGSGIKQGQPGGVTVYLLEPKYSSDWVSGCGMLANHDSLHLTYQLRRPDSVSFAERLSIHDVYLATIEGDMVSLRERIEALEGKQ